MTQPVVYRTVSHGNFNTGETLSFSQRSNVTVLSFGTEGMTTYLLPYLVVFDFFVCAYGAGFVDALCHVLEVYGEDYLDFKDPEEAGRYGKVILYLFRIHRRDLENFLLSASACMERVRGSRT